MFTSRLEIRLPDECDRSAFSVLFCDEHFIAFSDGVYTRAGAEERFDHMLQRALEFAFAKQSVIDRSTGELVGYSGADVIEFEGQTRFEFGYRLALSARGKGYATEAWLAILDLMSEHFSGEVLAFIAPTNQRSMAVIGRLGFDFWKLAPVGDYIDRVYRRSL
jgi:RimJ/RimL family protein N-acetyltransferase